MSGVIVVGGGFTGSFLAYQLARKGIRITVFEEDKKIGYPPHCAGLVSFSGLKRLGLLADVKKHGIVVNTIRYAVVHAGGKRKRFRILSTIIGVLDRPMLDSFVAGRAMDYGAEFFLGTKVSCLSQEGVSVGWRGFRSHIVVDAEGARRVLLSRFLGERILDSIPALQIDVKVDDLCDVDTIDVYFNVPDFFSWIIPLSHNRARIGVASKYLRDHYRFLRGLARRRFGRYTILRKFGGLVHVDGAYHRFVFGNIVGVGDVVGQTKPTTGGGVIIGGLSASLLAEVIKRNLENGLPLEMYDRVWRRIFSTNMGFMRTLRRIGYMLNPRTILRILFGLIPHEELNVKSDFDFQLDLILRFFSHDS